MYTVANSKITYLFFAIMLVNTSGVASSQNVPAKSPLSDRQASVAARFQKLQELLLRLAEMEASENPERAALLRRAARQSSDQFILDKLKTASDSLQTEEFQKAVDNQEAATKELASLLTLLMSEDRSERIRAEKDRIQQMVKDLKRTLNNQRSVRARTENGADIDEVKEEQESVTERGEQIREQMKSEGGSEDPADPQNQANQSPDSQSDSQKTESNNNPISDSEQSEPGEQPNSEQPNSEQSPENPTGETPSNSQSPKDDSDSASNTEDSPKDPENADDTKGNEPSESEDGSDAKNDPAGSESQEAKDQNDPQSSSDSGSAPKTESQESQPSSPGSPPNQPSPSSPQSGQPSPSSPNPQSPSPQSPQQKAQQQLEKAIEKMQDAEQALEQAKREEATEKQREAEEQLREAIDELDKILRQLREEEMQRELARLEARLKKMATMQSKLLDDTITLASTPKPQRNRQTDLKAGELAFEEKKITLEADRALLLLREEGSSVAFPEVVGQIRDDTIRVSSLLNETKIDVVSQGIQRDILAALEEMIAATQKAQRELEEQSQQDQPPGSPPPSGQSQQPLVEAIAELKLIRTMQIRIQNTTNRYSDLIAEGNSSAEELLPLLRGLAERQDRLDQITRDIALERNQ